MLATSSEDSTPDIGYAPYVRDDEGIFYIYVSRLASHTLNLLKNPKASVLFIRAESESPNLHARERAVFQCGVNEIALTDPNYPLRIQAMCDEFGEVINLLHSLPDFHLFALHPKSGRYVIGFGRAFMIDLKADVLIPIEPGRSSKLLE